MAPSVDARVSQTIRLRQEYCSAESALVTQLTLHSPDASDYAIKVCVGEGGTPKTFFLPEFISRSRSEFFEKAMASLWSAAEHKTVNLPDEDPAIFSLYTQLLYNNCISINKPVSTREDLKANEENLVLSKIYVLAEKLEDATTKDIILDTMIARSRGKQYDDSFRFPGMTSIKIFYNAIPDPCLKTSTTIPYKYLEAIAVGMLERRLRLAGNTTAN